MQTSAGWVLYYSAPAAGMNGQRCIGVAIATTVTGPYTPQSQPLICPGGKNGAVDTVPGRPVADAGVIDGFLSLGAAVAQVRAVGAAPSPAQAHAVTDWPLLASAGIGTRLKLSRVIALVTAAEIVVAPRRLNLRFLDEESAPFSRPGAFVHAGLETAF